MPKSQPHAGRARTRSPNRPVTSNGSRIFLGRDLVPGEYVLQVVVTDALADPGHAAAVQWIDFEIVK